MTENERLKGIELVEARNNCQAKEPSKKLTHN